MIQVSIPANVPLREFAYDAEVELVNQSWIQSPIMFFEKELLSIGLLRQNDLVLKRQPNQGNSTNQIEGKK